MYYFLLTGEKNKETLVDLKVILTKLVNLTTSCITFTTKIALEL